MQRDLDRLTAAPHDLLVVGGGIHGAAAAWEAARRGVRVALVEARDFGSGASWNSLKTIHGGLRHLQRLDLGHLRESVREQRALLELAPALVQPLPFLVPCGSALDLATLAAGLTVYELLAGDRRLPARRLLSAADARRLAPRLESHAMKGAGLWYDAQAVSTERLLLAFVLAAAESGACVANHVRVTGLRRGAGGRALGVEAVDESTGRALAITARSTIDVSGGGLDAVLHPVGPRPQWLGAINLVAAVRSDGPAIGLRSGGRYLFAVPWNGVTLLGTDYAEPGTEPDVQAAAFFSECQRVFPFLELVPDHLVLVHRGLVPGRGGAAGLQTRPAVVDHARSGMPGIVSAYPVKYTTARALAVHLVDQACGRAATPPLAGALAEARIPEGSVEERTLRAVRDEMAATLADAVLRRLDLGTAGPAPAAALDRVAAVMAAELGWSATELAAQRHALDATYDLAGAARSRL